MRLSRCVLTGIKLLAGIQQSAPVVHGQLIALLGLALALDGVGDIDLEFLGGDDANGARGQGGEKQGCLHGGEKSTGRGTMEKRKMRRTRRCGRGRASGFLGRGFRLGEEKRGGENIWPVRNGKGGWVKLRLEAMWPASRISGESSAGALAIGQWGGRIVLIHSIAPRQFCGIPGRAF